MSDTSECNGLVGAGVVQYMCTLPHPHDGPGVAVELPSSKVRRAQWMKQQSAAQAAPPQSAPPQAAPGETPPPVETPETPEAPAVDHPVEPTAPAAVESGFNDHETRRAQAMASLSMPYDDLPPVIKSWTAGAAAQLALVELWRAWQNVEAAGGDALLLTASEINRIVPENLRV